MFRNYVTIALRNLRRQKIYTVINVFGLALAIACAVLIYHFVRSEMTYDTFHEGYENIYRVTTVVQFREIEQWERTPYPLATVMEEQVPGLEAVARLVSLPEKIVHVDEQVTHGRIHLAGPAFFDIFDFPLERGDPTAILEDPTAVIISKAVQEKYFARRDPVGMRLAIYLRDDTFTEFTIQGVAAPIPENSSIQFDFLLSEQIYPDIFGEPSLTDWFPKTLAVLLGLTLGVALLSGVYPAVILSRFKPAAVLKGVLKLGGRSFFSRALITFQFTLSIVLIACTLLMSNQLRHVSRHNLGYDTELLLYQRLTKRVDATQVERYRQAAGQNPNVLGLSATRATLTGDEPGSIWVVTFQGEHTTVPGLTIDYDFLDVMGIDLVAGRNLSRDYPGDLTGSVLVNEAFLAAFGVEDPIGQPVPFGGEQPPVIVGVVKDFHFQSLRKAIEPLILHLRPDVDYSEIITRIQGDRIPETLAHLQTAWEGLGDGTPFEYTFFDEVVQNQYETERHFRTINTYASYFAILIACLGLFGLTALSVARRTKEMGIRKVLGASSARILLLFNREYLYLLLVANLAAWPTAYYVMTLWLENFTYRIEIGPGAFVLAGLIVGALAGLTITTQALRTAQVNPADTLRYE